MFPGWRVVFLTGALASSFLYAQAPTRSRSAGRARVSAPRVSAPRNAPARSAPAPTSSRSASYGRYRTGGGAAGGGYNPFRSRRGGFRPPRNPVPTSISGRILSTAGGAPSVPVDLQVVCPSGVFPVSYTRANGGFRLPFGSSFSTSPYGVSRRGWGFGGVWRPRGVNSCALRASCPGYYPLAVPLRGLWSGYGSNLNLGKLKMKPVGGALGQTVSFTSLSAPKKARKHYEKGLKLMGGVDPKPKKAVEELEKAVELHPNYAAAWSMLGKARLRLGDAAGARAAFEKSVESDAMFLGPYNPLIRMAAGQGEWKQVAELSRRAIRLNPIDSELKYHNALANFSLGRRDRALRLAQALANQGLARRLPEAGLIAALAHEARGDYARAAREYRAYLVRGEGRFDVPTRRTLRDVELAANTLAALAPPLP